MKNRSPPLRRERARQTLAALLLYFSLSHKQIALAFSSRSVRSTAPSRLFQETSASSSKATAQSSDSSYEALRRKFGLTNETVEKVDVDDEPDTVQAHEDIDNNFGVESESEVDEISPLISTQVATEADERPQTSSQLGTIYSRKFSRFNIPLTTIDRVSKDDMKKELDQRRQKRLQRGVIVKLKPEPVASDKGFFNNLFRGVDLSSNNIMSLSAKSVDPQIEKAYLGKRFRWVTSEPYKSNSSNNPRLIDEDLVAAADFWRMAADISQQNERDGNQWYLALPETTSSVAQTLCDIINWYADYLESGSISSEKDSDRVQSTIILRARLDATHSSIPIVEFTGKYQPRSTQEQLVSKAYISHNQPTTEDTEKRTKSWVQRLLVKHGVCPFTKSNIKSGQGLGDVGVPVANIMYRHSGASFIDNGASGEMYILMADTWESIRDMIAAGPSGKYGVSSILLSAPSFDDNFALWAGPVFAMLEAGVGAIQAEEMIGVVCFHPDYATPDGSTFPGFGHMHSLPRLKKWYNQFTSSGQLTDNEIAAGGAWQRRTPHAVINVLRAEQLEAAEDRRQTGILYERNIRVLVGREEGIGSEQLKEDLRREQSL